MIDHPNHAQEEDDPEIVDSGREIGHARVSCTLFFRLFGEHILLDAVQSARSDERCAGGDRYIDYTRKRQEVYLSIVAGRSDVEFAAEGTVGLNCIILVAATDGFAWA